MLLEGHMVYLFSISFLLWYNNSHLSHWWHWISKALKFQFSIIFSCFLQANLFEVLNIILISLCQSILYWIIILCVYIFLLHFNPPLPPCQTTLLKAENVLSLLISQPQAQLQCLAQNGLSRHLCWTNKNF